MEAIEILRSHASFITQEQLENLGPGRLLGEGGFGSVRQLVFEGSQTVVKELLDSKALFPLLREARFMAELNGAGGVPRPVALCPNPPAMIQDYVGQLYEEYLMNCSVADVLNSLISISQRLEEIHAKGILHNDLKMNNITFSGTVSEPEFHIIDLGWACRSGQVAVECMKPMSEKKEIIIRRKVCQEILGKDYTFESTADDEEEDEDDDLTSEKVNIDPDDELVWMAPELRQGGPVWPSGDVYSFGFLVESVIELCPQTFLTEALTRLS